MKVLVDTSVWSLSLRRREHQLSVGQLSLRRELAALVKEGRAAIIGPIRQEVLSGIKERKQFDIVRDSLRELLDESLSTEDYEHAAALDNECQGVGIVGGHTDLLICAVAIERDWPILTTDNDFQVLQRQIPIRLHRLRT